MAVTLRIEGLQGLQRALDQYGEEAEAAVRDVVNLTGEELRADIIKRYQRGPKTGRTYRKYNPKRVHKASAPGEAPATDTGRLVSQTMFQSVSPFAVEVFNSLKYAEWLEYGTRRIAPRPAWVPAVEKVRPKFVRRLEQVLARFTR